MTTLQEIKIRCREVGSCWEWISNAKNRERKLHPQMRTEKGGKPRLVRRVAYEAKLGPIPEGRYIVPGCGSSFCVNPDHQWALSEYEKNLRTGRISASSPTRSASIAGAWRASGRTRMTLERANQIRAAEGSLRQLAAQFGMSASMIGAIRRGEYWRDHSSPMTGMFTQLLASNESSSRRTA